MLTPLDLAQLEEFERRWDPLLGGVGTRGHREMIAFGIARLVACGAELDHVLGYFRDCVTKWGGLGDPPPSAPEACS
jgi:hypothetical protein